MRQLDSFICKGGFFFLVLILSSFLVVSVDFWNTFGNDARASQSVDGTSIGGNYSGAASYGLNLGLNRQPVIADLDGNGFAEVAFMYGSTLTILDKELNFVVDSITTGNNNQLTAMTNVYPFKCGNSEFVPLVFVDNPPQNSSNVTFQVWCFNGTALWNWEKVNVWQAGTYYNGSQGDGGSSVACDLTDCVFRSCRNDETNPLFVCAIDQANISCYRITSGSIYGACEYYVVPVLNDFDKDGENDIALIGDADNNGSIGFTIRGKDNLTGLTLAIDNIAVYNPNFPYLAVMPRPNPSYDYVGIYRENGGYDNFGGDLRFYNLAGSFVWSNNDNCGGHSGGAYDLCFSSNMVKVNSNRFCIVQDNYHWTPVQIYYNTYLKCFSTEGFVVDANSLGTSVLDDWRITSFDVNNDGGLDVHLGYKTFDCSVVGSVCAELSLGNISPSDRGLFWDVPYDFDLDGKVDILQVGNQLNLYGSYTNLTGLPSYLCSDTDSSSFPTINYTQKGTAVLNVNSGTDYCSGSVLTEFYCADTSTLTWVQAACSGGCINGSCISCTESWSCTEWGDCNFANSSQSRVCIDASNCGTTYGKPAVSQVCGLAETGVPILNLPASLIDTGKLNDPATMSIGFLPEIFFAILVWVQYLAVPLFFLIVVTTITLISFLILKKVGG